jgi:hypothetical protein
VSLADERLRRGMQAERNTALGKGIWSSYCIGHEPQSGCQSIARIERAQLPTQPLAQASPGTAACCLGRAGRIPGE